MYYEKVIVYSLYAQNLLDPSRSFAPDITIKDFKRGIDYRSLDEAKIIKYVNPRGTEIILKNKYGVKK